MALKKPIAWRKRESAVRASKDTLNRRWTELSLGLIGTMIAFAALISSVLQYQANELQARVADAQFRPQLTARITTDPTLRLGARADKIEFVSTGGPIHSPNISSLSRAWWKFYLKEPKLRCLPIGTVFGGTNITSTQQTAGLIFVASRIQPNLRWNWLQHRFPLLALEANGFWGQPKIDTVFQVKYADSLGRMATLYFYDDGWLIFRLDDLEGPRVWQAWSKKLIDLPKLSYDPVAGVQSDGSDYVAYLLSQAANCDPEPTDSLMDEQRPLRGQPSAQSAEK